MLYRIDFSASNLKNKVEPPEAQTILDHESQAEAFPGITCLVISREDIRIHMNLSTFIRSPISRRSFSFVLRCYIASRSATSGGYWHQTDQTHPGR